MLDHSETALVGTPVRDCFVEDDEFERCFAQTARGNRTELAVQNVDVVRSQGEALVVDLGFRCLESDGRRYVLVALADASERTRQEIALRDEEARYHSLVEGLPLNVFFKDLHCRFTFANESCLRLMERKLEELVGKTDFDLFPTELAEKYRRDDERIVTSGEVFEDVEEYGDNTGERRYVQVLKAPVRNAEGDVVGIQGMFWDVSPRKRAEQALLESETRKSAILEAAFDGIVMAGEDATIVEFNEAAEQIFGIDSDTAIGKHFLDTLFPQRTRDVLRPLVRELLADGDSDGRRLEVEAVRSDGTVFDVEVSLRRIPVDERPAIVAFLRDVTERRRAEAALERERFLLHSLMNNVPDNIYFKDRAGTFLRINKAKARRSGLDNPDQAVGLSDHDIFPPEHAAAAQADEQQVMQSGQPIVGKEERLLWPDGRTTWSSTTKVPLRDESGAIVGTFGISRDVTDQKRVQEALREAKEAAEAANRAKSDFLANTSHEIRTPMNAIIGMTQLLLAENGLDDRQREYLGIVEDSAESLLTVINQVLDFSKVESGHVDVVEEPFDVRDLFGDAVRSLALRGQRKGLEIAFHVAPDVPEALVTDTTKLRQVVVNLVGNAVKFTDEGEVVVDVAVESRTADGRFVLRTAVRDTGIGIPTEQLDSIFEAFHQVDMSSTRRFGGTGLGLSISAQLVDLLGGRIWATSEVGRGSEFRFTLPLREATLESSQPPPESLSGLRVLVVDDNATNRAILEEMLRNWGMSPRCEEGAEGARLALQEAIDLDRRIDLVLSDVQMPHEDGFALAGYLRGQSMLSETPIILLTSGDRPEDAARCRELRINRYIRKPAKTSELFNAIATAVNVPPVAKERAERADEPSPGTPLRVLVVEDSLPNRKLAVGLLERWGHSWATAEHGQEALDRVREDGPFDVVLMDVQMPLMDGLEATAAIRELEAGTETHLPIIAMTAHAMAEDRDRCLAAGMDGYVSKPIRPAVLRTAIETVTGSGQEASNESPETTSSDAPESLVDWDAAMEIVDGDRDLLGIVHDAFLEELDETLEHVANSAEEGDADELRRWSHKLKGAFRSIAANVLERDAAAMEKAAGEGSTDDAADRVAAISRRIPALRRQLDEFRGNG